MMGRPTPPEVRAVANREALEQKKEKLLEEIFRDGGIIIRDNMYTFGDWRAKQSRLKEDRGRIKQGVDVPNDKDDSKIKESVTLMPVVDHSDIEEEVKKPLQFLRKKEYRFRHTSQPRRHSELVVNGYNEQAYELKYGFDTKEPSRAARKNYDSSMPDQVRQNRVIMAAIIYLPEKVAREACKLIQQDPTFIRRIIKNMVMRHQMNNGQTSEWNSRLWEGWLEKRPRPSEIYINTPGGIDAEFDPTHAHEIE